jgi:hypothetical protein
MTELDSKYDITTMLEPEIATAIERRGNARAGGLTLILSVAHDFYAADPNELDFMRLRLSAAFLHRIAQSQAYQRATPGAEELRSHQISTQPQMSEGIRANDDRHTWRLLHTKSAFWFMSKTHDHEATFTSVQVDSSALMRFLDDAPGAEAELAAYVKLVGPFLLLAHSDETFLDRVTRVAPDVSAEMTAIEMRAKVSERLAHDVGGASDESTQPAPAARRRRMGV